MVWIIDHLLVVDPGARYQAVRGATEARHFHVDRGYLAVGRDVVDPHTTLGRRLLRVRRLKAERTCKRAAQRIASVGKRKP